MGRQFKTIFHRSPCATLVLSMCGFFSIASPVSAQEVGPTDAERIELMRDRAGVVAEAEVAVPGVSAEQPAVEAKVAEEKPLAPNESLPLGTGEGDIFNGQAVPAETGSLGDGWLMSTLAALGVVIAIVFGIRWLLRRGGVVGTAAPQGGVVEVLSRTTVAPRSHVVLMRVGTRILVVSDSPAGMRTLASVEDAQEVAQLLGAVDSAKPTSMSQGFGSVMKKLSGQWSGDEAEDMSGDLASAEAEYSEGQGGAVSSLRGRLAALSNAGGRA